MPLGYGMLKTHNQTSEDGSFLTIWSLQSLYIVLDVIQALIVPDHPSTFP